MPNAHIQTHFAYYVAYRAHGKQPERHWFHVSDLRSALRLVSFMRGRDRLIKFGIDLKPDNIRLWGAV